MNDTTITVTGRAETELPPERANVSISVQLDGAEPEPQLRGAAELSKQLADGLRESHHPADGPVTSWSSDQLRTWSERPWNADGVQLPLVHHAAIGIRAEFSDFGALSAWLTTTAALPGVSIGHLEWTLLDETRARVMAELRSLAVEDAFAKARNYAAAIGRAEVVPESLTEEDDGQPIRMSKVQYLGGGPEVEFTPTPVQILVRVVVRFATGTPLFAEDAT
jgi:uncharacterized protein YggE